MDTEIQPTGPTITDHNSGAIYWLVDDALFAAPMVVTGGFDYEQAVEVDFWSIDNDDAKICRAIEARLKGGENDS